MEEKIFSIAEASQYLGVFPLTLRNWEKKGKIRVFRTPGGHRRFRKSDLDTLMGTSTGSGRLRDIIKNLESAVTHDSGSREQLNKIIEDLKQVAEEAK
ncbi:helix-turn-helix domain-containing protein [Candidatus Omnitrophota bacterium]